MARARTCYHHLAGQLGVRLADALTSAGLFDRAAGLALTGTAPAWLHSQLDIDVAVLAPGRRPLVRSCPDWTERKPHLGGVVGAALCDQFFRRGWITRIGTGRAVRVTTDGEDQLRRLCGIDLDEVAQLPRPWD